MGWFEADVIFVKLPSYASPRQILEAVMDTVLETKDELLPWGVFNLLLSKLHLPVPTSTSLCLEKT